MNPLRTNSASRQLVAAALPMFAIALLVPVSPATGHEGPDPIAYWQFASDAVLGNRVVARIGPDAHLKGRTRVVADRLGESIEFSGWGAECVVAEDIADVRGVLPKEAVTISAWVTIDKGQPWGGIFGALQDNGNAEKGVLLGYNNEHFYFALASEGADDGDGKITYLSGKNQYETGRWYHVVGVYNGREMKLYVNGELDGFSDEQSGPILYPSSAPLVIGAYRDNDENHQHRGRIRQISVYDLAAKDSWVEKTFKRGRAVSSLTAADEASTMEFVIKPYLQYGTQDGMTVMWQTNQPGTTVVHYGETAACGQTVEGEGGKVLHEVRIKGLEAETLYFYRTETVSDTGETIFSEPYTFTTAVKRDTPFAFAVVGDTQGNPKVCGKLCELAWAQRPSFVMHAGDLVNTGPDNSNWTGHFFPGMEELICRVPLFPVLGNHEQDARNYYDYMSLPEPEYIYEFRYGNAHFFMIDSNRNVNPGSEQYKWLDEHMGASDATWKFACHHHPPYSSDEDDYGNLWQTNKSSHGDPRVRDLVPLYEKHGVDIVWNGHIHSYERTWPVKGGAARQDAAPMYMITGGAGGGLETAGPVRPFFQNNVRHGHHYVMVFINGTTLEFRAYTLDDRLFDTFRLTKRE